jgi:hypothetical protein
VSTLKGKKIKYNRDDEENDGNITKEDREVMAAYINAGKAKEATKY